MIKNTSLNLNFFDTIARYKGTTWFKKSLVFVKVNLLSPLVICSSLVVERRSRQTRNPILRTLKTNTRSRRVVGRFRHWNTPSYHYGALLTFSLMNSLRNTTLSVYWSFGAVLKRFSTGGRGFRYRVQQFIPCPSCRF